MNFNYVIQSYTLFFFYIWSVTYCYYILQIESALPSISRPIMSLDGNEDAIVGALKQSLVIYIVFVSWQV